MTSLVSPSHIEKIVGVNRHRQAHYGRAVSAEQTVYILHSQRCLDSGIDLRECRFSVALDLGIELEVWDDLQDRPVVLGVWLDRLVPLVGTEIADDRRCICGPDSTGEDIDIRPDCHAHATPAGLTGEAPF